MSFCGLAGLAQLHHLVGDGVQRLVPGDRHELRIDAAALDRVGALHRHLDAIRVVDLLRDQVAARADIAVVATCSAGCRARAPRGRPARRSGSRTTACSPGRCWPPSRPWPGCSAWPCAGPARCAAVRAGVVAQPVAAQPAETPDAMMKVRLVSLMFAPDGKLVAWRQRGAIAAGNSRETRLPVGCGKHWRWSSGWRNGRLVEARPRR